MTVDGVRPLDEARAGQTARALALAFQNDPFFVYVVPNDERRAEQLKEFLAINLKFGLLYGEVLATPNSDAASIWIPPGLDLTPERAAESGFDRVRDIFGQEALVRLGEVLDFLQPLSAAAMPERYWYLQTVGVTPEKQGQGLGTALLKGKLEQISDEGLPCYLETFEPRNVDFYLRLGFESLADTVDPKSGLRVWTFGRFPLPNP